MKKTLLTLLLPLIIISLFIYNPSESAIYEGSATFTFKIIENECKGEATNISVKSEDKNFTGICTITEKGTCVLPVKAGTYKIQAWSGECKPIELTLTHPGTDNLNIDLSFLKD